MPSPEIQPFFSWVQSHNGYIDTTAMDVIQLPLSEGGRGAVALVDIPENHVLFSIPRSLVLTTRTSSLPSKFGSAAWKKLGLHQGWSGLILCMMWEAALGAKGKWSAYFDMMPTKFDTPMFWNEEDLAELKGTSVVEKLGKEQAEKDYQEKVVPAIQSRSDLFAKEDIPMRYSLEVFHIMGTRILSRSFTLANEEEDEEDADEGKGKENEESKGHEPPGVDVEDLGNTSLSSAMDVDEPGPSKAEQLEEVHSLIRGDDEHDHDDENGEQYGEEEEESSEDEDAPEVAMVPLADILNARYKTDNVKLFYEPDCLRMVSTRTIKAGEQIWNTYGDLPNADLLRGFGHVDYLPLPYAPGECGNPGDVIELRADLVVQCVLDLLNSSSEGSGKGKELKVEDMEERIDWWLEEGGDDVFTLEHPSASSSSPSPNSTSTSSDPTQTLTSTLPVILVSFARLLLLTPADFAKAQAKGKPPKPKADARALRVVLEALRRRGNDYGTTFEEDTQLLATASTNPMPLNKRHALVVRMGEKRVLEAVRKSVEEIIGAVEKKEAGAASEDKDKGRAVKRKAERAESSDGRKRRK